MASTVFTLPFLPALGVNGTPQSGAKLYFYDAGTLTPHAVYTDAARTIPHASPVVADGAGRFDPIYIDPAVSYRIILQDALGGELGDIDNYSADPLTGNLAADDGANLIGTTVRDGEASETAQAFIHRKFGNKFDPTDPEFGAVEGGKTGDAATDLAIATANQIAFAACIAAFKAKLASDDRATFVLPEKDFLIATAPYPGTAEPSVGVSAVGGAHWRGASVLPASDGWSCHGLVFDGLSGGRLISEGGRLIRIENDPYNSAENGNAAGTAGDDTNSTILIVRSNEWVMEGFWDHEGFQDDNVDSTQAANCGSFIDVSYGCQQFALPARIRSWKHQNALAIGNNRASGFTTDPGQSGIDILQPCIGWEVGDIEAYVGNHAVFVNVVDQWAIRSIRHGFKDYTYGGVAQGDYIQRTMYLLGCGRGTVGRVQSTVADKACILLTAYPSSRSYKDMDVDIGECNLIAPTGQDDNFYNALEILDHNNATATLRKIKARIGKFTSRGHKNGIFYDHDSAAFTGDCLERFEVESLDIEATSNGVVIQPYGTASNIKLGKGSVVVRKDTTYHATSEAANGVKIASQLGEAAGASATTFVRNVSIGQLNITSGNRPLRLTACDGITLGGPAITYENQSVSGASTTEFTVAACKNYGTIAYRLTTDSAPSSSDIIEPMPNAIKGRFVRADSFDPGTIAAGASSTSARTVTGARAGMPVNIVITSPPAGIIATGYVSADNTVTVTTRNVGTASRSSGTSLSYTITVFAV